MFICRAAGFEIKGHLDTVHASYEKVLAEEARKSGEYRPRGWYGTLNAKDLLEEKAVLENRLKDLRNAQADVEVFNRSVQEAGRHIRAIFSDPSKHQRPFLIVFEKDPLKWPLKKEAVAAVTKFLNAVQRVELWLVQKWAKLYPKAKHAEMVGFDRECDTAAVAIYRLNSVRYDIKADLEDCEKIQKRLQTSKPGPSACSQVRRFREEARQDACGANPALLGAKVTSTVRASSGRGRSPADYGAQPM